MENYITLEDIDKARRTLLIEIEGRACYGHSPFNVSFKFHILSQVPPIYRKDAWESIEDRAIEYNTLEVKCVDGTYYLMADLPIRIMTNREVMDFYHSAEVRNYVK